MNSLSRRACARLPTGSRFVSKDTVHRRLRQLLSTGVLHRIFHEEVEQVTRRVYAIDLSGTGVFRSPYAHHADERWGWCVAVGVADRLVITGRELWSAQGTGTAGVGCTRNGSRSMPRLTSTAVSAQRRPCGKLAVQLDVNKDTAGRALARLIDNGFLVRTSHNNK